MISIIYKIKQSFAENIQYSNLSLGDSIEHSQWGYIEMDTQIWLI